MGAKEVLGWDGTEVLGERGWVRKRPGFEWAGMLARDGRVCVCGKWWCGSGRRRSRVKVGRQAKMVVAAAVALM